MTVKVIQIGGESTPGTAVACTQIWRGTGVPEDQRDVQFADEDIGRYGPSNRPYTPSLKAGWGLDPTPATFEQMPIIYAAGIQNLTTGAADGAGTDKVYTYTRPVTAENTIKLLTLRGGSSIRPRRSEYTFVESYKLSGKANGPLMMSADLIGRQFTDEALTAGLNPIACEIINFLSGKLYINNLGSAFGLTQVSSVFLGMELSVKTGWYPYFCADGNLYFNEARYSRQLYSASLQITFRYHASSVTEEQAWENRTARKLQVKFEGAAPATPGTTYQKKTLIENLIGSWEKFEKIGEMQGDDIVVGTFRGAIDDSAATAGSTIVVNELATIL